MNCPFKAGIPSVLTGLPAVGSTNGYITGATSNSNYINSNTTSYINPSNNNTYINPYMIPGSGLSMDVSTATTQQPQQQDQ